MLHLSRREAIDLIHSIDTALIKRRKLYDEIIPKQKIQNIVNDYRASALEYTALRAEKKKYYKGIKRKLKYSKKAEIDQTNQI